ncbi:MAG: ribbon-helix-helix domain-containing protein [Candidatus Bathyarchaeia archaeon]
MIPEYPERVALRISREERQKLERFVMEGKYKNLSQVIREAIKRFLRARKTT